MKPFLLLTLDYPPRLGGVASYLAHLAECFPPDQLAVLAPEEEGVHASDMVSPVSIYRRRLSWHFLKPGWLPALYWTDWFCRKEPPSAIIVSHLLPMGEVAYLLRRWRGWPYVVIVHGYDVALAAAAHGRKRRWAKRILSGAALVVANSGYTARLAETLGAAPERLLIARPSPDLPRDIAVAPEKTKIVRAHLAPENDFLLLSVGRLVERKGFDTCLRVVAVLRKAGRHVRYAIVGDGPDLPRLKRLADSLGVSDSVTFVGSVSESDKPAFFAACDALVMVPRGIGPDVEGFGIVYLEANLLGKPVIGSRSGGVPEAVVDGETGILVNPDDVAGLTQVIERLMDEPDLAVRLGQAGRRRVLDEFGWRREFRPVIERLKSLADKTEP